MNPWTTPMPKKTLGWRLDGETMTYSFNVVTRKFDVPGPNPSVPMMPMTRITKLKLYSSNRLNVSEKINYV